MKEGTGSSNTEQTQFRIIGGFNFFISLEFGGMLGFEGIGGEETIENYWSTFLGKHFVHHSSEWHEGKQGVQRIQSLRLHMLKNLLIFMF